jgi:hypothetical protein
MYLEHAIVKVEVMAGKALLGGNPRVYVIL